MQPERVQAYFSCAVEREAIRRRRAAGQAWPWTEDPVLRDYRFCNVFREDDRTTEWFRTEVRDHLAGWPAVEATLAFRWFNRIETGERIKKLLLHGWDSAEARRLLHGVTPVITGAYVIKTPDGMSKLDGVLWCIDNAREELCERAVEWGDKLEEAWDDLITVDYLGGFMAYEIVSDLRWTPVLNMAQDIMTWANPGPGAAGGLGHLEGTSERYAAHRMVRPSANRADLLSKMRQLLALSQDPANWPYAERPWSMREVEHWCCEYLKIAKAREGVSPKRRYEPPTDRQAALF